VPKRAKGGKREFEKWVDGAKAFSTKLETDLTKQLKAQNPAAYPLKRGAKQVYVLYAGAKDPSGAKTKFIGTPQELSEHDSLLRPMLGPRGGWAQVAADHSLDLQLGGFDGFENLCLLDFDFNRKLGSGIEGKVKTSIAGTLKKANEQLKSTGETPSKPLPMNSLDVLANWVVLFRTVKATTDFGTSQTKWTREQIEKGEHLKYFKAMTDKQVVQEGFEFKEGEIPERINVFPGPTGGYAVSFEVADGGKTLKKPKFFYRGFTIYGDAALTLPDDTNKNHVMAKVPVRRTKKEDPKKKDSIIVFADAELSVRHDENLGFGGYITDESRTAAFAKGKVTFKPLCPIEFSDVQITTDGDWSLSAEIMS
jgi:hypothetical protein